MHAHTYMHTKIHHRYNTLCMCKVHKQVNDAQLHHQQPWQQNIWLQDLVEPSTLGFAPSFMGGGSQDSVSRGYMFACLQVCEYLSIYIYIYTYTYMCIYIYIERERERYASCKTLAQSSPLGVGHGLSDGKSLVLEGSVTSICMNNHFAQGFVSVVFLWHFQET